MGKKEWFGEWFNSPYYHILYKDRDHQEARLFIDNLTGFFHLEPEHKIMDLACGKGRHSIYLNEKGLNVTGLDLSEQNIQYASKFENDTLKFRIHDMREPYSIQKFDFILNMFTSFGYFDSREENEETILSIAKALNSGGKFLLDFLNPYRVIHNLVSEEIKIKDGIEFHICRNLQDGFIVKDIEFEDDGLKYHFQERVKAIERFEFLEYFEHAGLKVRSIYGDYEFSEYHPENSDRMIFVAQK